MNALMLFIAITSFLAGAAAAVFLMMVIGIHKADRPRSLPGSRSDPLDAVTRSILRAGSWPDGVVLGKHDAD